MNQLTIASTLSRVDQNTLAVLVKLAGRHNEVWHSTATIAARLNLTIRAAQLRLRRLADLGLIGRVVDYGLRSRRRITLLFRTATKQPMATNERSDCADSAKQLRSASVPPLEPPYRTGIEERERTEAAAPRTPPPQVISHSVEGKPTDIPTTPQPTPKPTDEQTKAIRQLAQSAAPGDPLLPAVAVAALQTASSAVVTAALTDVAKKRGLRSPRGLFLSIMAEYARLGVEPEPPRRVENYEEYLERWEREAAEE